MLDRACPVLGVFVRICTLNRKVLSQKPNRFGPCEQERVSSFILPVCVRTCGHTYPLLPSACRFFGFGAAQLAFVSARPWPCGSRAITQRLCASTLQATSPLRFSHPLLRSGLHTITSL